MEGVLRIDELGVHRFGPYYTVNMTIEVDGGISVDAGHQISQAVEEKLLEKYSSGLRKVYIHYHPLVAQGVKDPFPAPTNPKGDCL